MPDTQHAIDTPLPADPEQFSDASAAVDRLTELYDEAADFLCSRFSEALAGGAPEHRVRAFYPE
ncbi:MAG: AMP nucleosidase, partial [Pseudomonadota bacterium]